MMSVEAHGAISGIEFRQTRCGSVVGRKSTATYQSTPLQQLTRGRLIAAHRAWETLTDADRSAWNAHATHPTTGRNTYVSMWLRFTMAGVPPLLTPNSFVNADPLAGLTIITHIHVPQRIYLQKSPVVIYNDLLICYCYPTFSARALPTLSKMRYLFAIPSNVPIYGHSVPINAPLYHVRIDQVSYQTADLISRHLFRVPNPGW